MSLKKLVLGLMSLQFAIVGTVLVNRVLFAIHVVEHNAFANSDFSLVMMICAFLCTAYITLHYLYTEQRQVMQQKMLHNIEKLNHELRSQRHDFLNHIQVIYSLIEMEEYKDTADYLNRVYGDIEKLNTFIKTKDTAINALLQAKANTCHEKKIEYRVSIATQLSELPVPSWEMCRCLGNLIDNGIAATSEFRGKKMLDIRFSETLLMFEFRITNSGEPLSGALHDRIFTPGFTTRTGVGKGMGLYIVKKIVDQYNGVIVIETSEGSTTFVLKFPKAVAAL